VATYGQTLEDALALKHKLLGYDRTVAERSRIYDAQSDYYSNTDWLSEKEKEVCMNSVASSDHFLLGAGIPKRPFAFAPTGSRGQRGSEEGGIALFKAT